MFDDPHYEFGEHFFSNYFLENTRKTQSLKFFGGGEESGLAFAM